MKNLPTLRDDSSFAIKEMCGVRCTGKANSLMAGFLSCFPDRASDGGSTSASDSTRDDAFRGLFSNRLDDFMDSTSSTGDIFPPPLASSRSGWPQKKRFPLLALVFFFYSHQCYLFSPIHTSPAFLPSFPFSRYTVNCNSFYCWVYTY